MNSEQDTRAEGTEAQCPCGQTFTDPHEFIAHLMSGHSRDVETADDA